MGIYRFSLRALGGRPRAGCVLIRHQPARAVSARVSRFRAFAGVQTVCEQSRGNLWPNAVGKVAAHPANARQTSLTNTSADLAHETQSKGESTQRSGRTVVD
jgi:hypothetical protein